LKKIFNNLSQKDLINNIRFVCKQWYNTAHIDAAIIYPFTSKVYGELLNDFANNIVFAVNVRQLLLKEAEQIDCNKDLSTQYDELTSVFECCPNLKGMKIQACCSKVSINCFDQIQKAVALKNISKLECVQLNICAKYLSYHPNLKMNLY
jgi:hypothetical protein